jgi:hypothetical protein
MLLILIVIVIARIQSLIIVNVGSVLAVLARHHHRTAEDSSWLLRCCADGINSMESSIFGFFFNLIFCTYSNI